MSETAKLSDEALKLDDEERSVLALRLLDSHDRLKRYLTPEAGDNGHDAAIANQVLWSLVPRTLTTGATAQDLCPFAGRKPWLVELKVVA